MAAPAFPCQDVGSYIPTSNEPWAKLSFSYAKLSPFKVLPGAQASFVLLLIGETQRGTKGGRSKKRTVASWAKLCNCEERQMSDSINDALERGLVRSFPELPRTQDGKLDNSNRPKMLEFYLPPPSAWLKIPNLPKPERRLKIVPKPEEESCSRLQDSEPSARTLTLAPRKLITEKLTAPTSELNFQNETGISGLSVAFLPRADNFILRLYVASESRSRLQDSELTARIRPDLDREQLRELIDSRLGAARSPSLPDSGLWKRVIQALGPQTPNAKLIALVDEKIGQKYRVKPGLLLTLAEQVREEYQREIASKARQQEHEKDFAYREQVRTARGLLEGLRTTEDPELRADYERFLIDIDPQIVAAARGEEANES